MRDDIRKLWLPKGVKPRKKRDPLIPRADIPFGGGTLFYRGDFPDPLTLARMKASFDPESYRITVESYIDGAIYSSLPPIDTMTSYAELRVIASVVDAGTHGSHQLHISVSRPDRDPTWSEIKAVRGAFFPPDIDAVMILPREEDYVNEHEHTFHVWQCPTDWKLL